MGSHKLTSPINARPPLHLTLAHQLSATISAARLELEPMGGRHAEFFFGPLQQDAIYQWISMNKPDSLSELRSHWRKLESTRMSPDGQFAWATWAVRRLSDGAYIGRVDAEIDSGLEAPNIGYYFFPDFWGQGYATEALRAATQHLVAQGVHRLVATVTVGNAASARVMLKAGYAYTRTLPGNDTIRGVAMDDDEYVWAATI